MARSSPRTPRALVSALCAFGLSAGAALLPREAEAAAESADTVGIGRGRALLSRFYAGDIVGLHAAFSPEMKTTLPLDRFTAFRKRVDEELGAERSIVEETVRTVDAPGKGKVKEFVRLAHFVKRPEVVEILWAWDTTGAILGFHLQPARLAYPSPNLDYRTKTTLRLPFQDEWFVFWGGRTVQENQHAIARDQRFAVDVLIRRNRATHGGDGKKNEDYFCFGKPILAPAAGRIVAAVDGIPDNVPGVLNAADPFGNHVIIDHGNGEFSVLAHFKQGSVAVKKGDEVRAGRALAACGNSGHSSEPHLHYHLQTTGVLFDAEGLPASFTDFQANGERVARGELSRGAVIRPE